MRGLKTFAVLGLLSFGLSGCASEGPSEPPTPSGPPVPPPAPTPNASGVLVISVTGALDGVAADIQVAGPNGFARVVSATTTLTSLAAGRYTITARSVVVAGRNLHPSPASQNVDIAGDVPVPVSVAYRGELGVLVVPVSGLPGGTNADIALTPPSGATMSVGASLIMDAIPGRWRLAASPVASGGSTYRPTPATYDVNVSVNDTTRMPVTYSIATGSIAVAITGLPTGVSGRVTVDGPAGFRRSVSSTETLMDLVPGTYVVNASEVVVDDFDFVPTPLRRTVEVTASLIAVPAPVAYAGSAGRISIATVGLPSGATPTFTISGVGGSYVVHGGATGLIPVGTYTVVASNVIVGSTVYTPAPISASVVVSGGATTAHTVTFTATGAPSELTVAISGLPTGANADVLLTGPAGYSRVLTTTTTLQGIVPGTYTLVARRVRTNAGYYGVTPAQITIDVLAASTGSTAVTYAALPSVVSVAISGLSGLGSANVSLTSPTGGGIIVNASTMINNAAPGRWRLAASPVVVAGSTFTPTPSTYDETVLAGDTLTWPVSYSLTTGSIAISVIGLPNGANGAVNVSGPGGYTRSVTSTITLTNLVPGSYTVSAAPVTSGGDTYQPTPPTRTVNVTASLVAAAAPVVYATQPVALTITTSGLPGNVTPSFALSGSEGTRVINGAGVVSDVAPGTYSLSAATIANGGTTYTPTPTSRVVVVEEGSTTVANFVYSTAGTPGALQLTVSGLSGGAGDVLVTGPNSFSQVVTATTTLSGLSAGSYSVVVRNVRLAQGTFAATPITRTVDVVAGATASHTVVYAALPAVIEVSASGLPGGVNAAIALTAPGGAVSSITANTIVSPAATGRWQLAASNVSSGGSTYAPTPASYDQTVLAGDTLRFPVSYAVASGGIAISVGGLPMGATGDVLVTGPGGYSQSVSSTTTLTNLAPGTYSIAANSVTVSGVPFVASPALRTVSVTASLVAAAAPISYSSQAGSLSLTIGGLPGATLADVLVTGPNSYSQAVTATGTLSGLGAGAYTIAIRNVRAATGTFGAASSTQSVTVSAGGSASSTITYAALPAVVEIPVSGLPGGASAAMTVTPPVAAAYSVTGSTVINPAAVGRWRLSASSVSSGGSTYAPTPSSYDQTVLAGDTLRFPVAYALSTGSIAIVVSGLPGGVNGSVTVTGPASFSQSVTATTTLTNLAPGAYTVTSSNVTSGGNTYAPTPTSRAVTVTASLVAESAPVGYTLSGGGPSVANLSIENMYVTQAVQNWAGTAKIVASRDALVRVFVKAAEANTLAPDVRVRVYDGATLLETYAIAAPGSSVPTSIVEGTLSASWNVLIPAANVRANMRVLADVDPANTLGESNRADNIWPTNGTAASISTTTAPTLTVKFIPLVNGGLTGNVSDANKDQFLATARRMLPLQQVNSSVRAAYTTNAAALQSSNSNSAWNSVLSEINALRTADGAPSSMHYYGVAKVSYTSGVAGYGYIPGRAALGWDYLPSGDGIAAHELGHNFSRPHTPCGVSGDATYPYSGGTTGVWGWNSATNSLMSPTSTDVMGYCSNVWISDWSWGKMADYRASAGMIVNADAVGDGLLIWGRVTDGKVTLEPAFRLRAKPSARASKGSHRLAITDMSGATLLNIPLETERVDHDDAHDERHFAVVVPWSEALEQSVADISVIDPRSPIPLARRSSVTGKTPRAQTAVGMPEPAQSLRRVTSSKASVEWNTTAYPMAMVRDAVSGDILAFLRRTGDGFVDAGRAVDIVFSDGVRSQQKRITPSP